MQKEIWKSYGVHIGGGNGNLLTAKASLNIKYWWASGTFDLMGSNDGTAEVMGRLEDYALHTVMDKVADGASTGRLTTEIDGHEFNGWWTVE